MSWKRLTFFFGIFFQNQPKNSKLFQERWEVPILTSRGLTLRLLRLQTKLRKSVKILPQHTKWETLFVYRYCYFHSVFLSIVASAVPWSRERVWVRRENIHVWKPSNDLPAIKKPMYTEMFIDRTKALYIGEIRIRVGTNEGDPGTGTHWLEKCCLIIKRCGNTRSGVTLSRNEFNLKVKEVENCP